MAQSVELTAELLLVGLALGLRCPGLEGIAADLRIAAIQPREENPGYCRWWDLGFCPFAGSI
jgi:hypothetical protein